MIVEPSVKRSSLDWFLLISKWVVIILLVGLPFLSLPWLAVEYQKYSPARLYGYFFGVVALLPFGIGVAIVHKQEKLKAVGYLAVCFILPAFLTLVLGFYVSCVNCAVRFGAPAIFRGEIISISSRTSYLNRGISKYTTYLLDVRNESDSSKILRFKRNEQYMKTQMPSVGDVLETNIQCGILGYFCEAMAGERLIKNGLR